MQSRGNYSMDMAQDKKGNYVHSEPSKDLSFGHRLQLLDFPVNNELSPQKNHITTNTKETMLTKGVVSSNDDESHGNEMDCETSCQSKEPMNISAEAGVQSKDNALSPHKVGKSAETTGPIEASHFSLNSGQPELDNELKPQRPTSQDIHSVESEGDGRAPPPKSGPNEHTNDLQNSDKATDCDHPTTPSNSMSSGQPPQPVSYPQQNTIGPVSDQQPWPMNEMLQYHYHQQQQLLQQQYQQQLQMQNQYFQTQQQYMNQQPYQQYQQHYVQQQPTAYQQTTSFDQSQQGQTQYHQSQELTYQAYQMAYQQQYQQYQGYQHPSQKQQDELVHSQQHLAQTMGQNLKVCDVLYYFFVTAFFIGNRADILGQMG